MNKEDILEMSKQENKGLDIANLEAAKSGMQIGWIVVICLLALVAVVDAIKFNHLDSGIFFAVMAGSFSIFLYKYMKLRKKHELCVSVIYGISALCFLVSWIINLVR